MNDSPSCQSSRPILSCLPCRRAKRKCDRTEPCSNCVQRNISCRYNQRSSKYGVKVIAKIQDYQEKYVTVDRTLVSPRPSSDAEAITARLTRLENAVFPVDSAQQTSLSDHGLASDWQLAPVGSHLPTGNENPDKQLADFVATVAKALPPRSQGRLLFEQLCIVSKQHWLVLHIPTFERQLAEVYDAMEEKQTPRILSLVAVFTIFSCVTFGWSGALLKKLQVNSDQISAASEAYSRSALLLLDNKFKPVLNCTESLISVCNLAHRSLHAHGMTDEAVNLRMRCGGMARMLGVPRLDTPARKKERLENGFDALEVEMLRRAWWNYVAHDWLGAFSGGVYEGTYLNSPKHMNIDLPSHVDDEYVTPEGVTNIQPLSKRTVMSTFLYRVRLATICREIVDALPSQLQDTEPADYSLILELDKKFTDFRENLPPHFVIRGTLDEEINNAVHDHSLSFVLNKFVMDFTLLIRVCRLHRPYFMLGMGDARYAYSHKACVRAAQSALDLRLAMDKVGKLTGLFTNWSWVVMHNSFIAALILATEVSYNPAAEDAERRREQVLSMCNLMERSIDESGSVVVGLQHNLQTLVSTLRPGKTDRPVVSNTLLPVADSALLAPINQSPTQAAADVTLSETVAMPMEFDIDQLFLDFVELAPDMDGSQWDSLFENVYSA